MERKSHQLKLILKIDGMNLKSVWILLLAIFLSSCSEKKKPLSFYDNQYMDEDSVEEFSYPITTTITYGSSEAVSIPFVEERGIKLIDVTINEKFTVKMILDSGCSATLISIAEAKYLYDKGCFTQDDILGVTQSQIADGSIMENMVINLRELVIGGQISCSNVTAIVSANAQAPLLLGNDVLDRVPSYSVNNQHKTITFQIQ